MAKMKVTRIKHDNSDLTVVNAAKVSFDKMSKSFSLKLHGGLIKFLAKHRHFCYDDQTEVFTERGWINFSELSYSDKVAEVFDGVDSMRFVKPNYIKADSYVGEMYCYQNNKIDYCVTPNHRMMVQTRRSDGWNDLDVLVSEKIHGTRIRMCRSPTSRDFGKDGTFKEGQYLGFLLGDGYRESNIRVKIRLKRERKIEYIREVLKSLNKDFVENVTYDGVTNFIIKDSIIFLEKSNKKSFGCLRGKSKEFLKGCLNGIIESDGSKKHSGFSIGSTSTHLLKDVEYISTRLGLPCSSVRKVNSALIEANDNYSDFYSLVVYGRKNKYIQTSNSKDFSIKFYNGIIYCASVGSGMLLVRRNGKPMVCGNTPFCHVRFGVHTKLESFEELENMVEFLGKPEYSAGLTMHKIAPLTWYIEHSLFGWAMNDIPISNYNNILASIADKCPYSIAALCTKEQFLGIQGIERAKLIPTSDVTLLIEAPIFVLRQLMKSVIGTVYNEVSRRYVDYKPEFYDIEEFRSRPEGSIKQGSGSNLSLEDQKYYQCLQSKMIEESAIVYGVFKDKVAPEQCRAFLTQNMMSKIWLTASPDAINRILGLRESKDAQKEIQDLASLIRKAV